MKTNNTSMNNKELEWSGTITALSQLDSRVYVRLSTPEIGARFLQQAEAEGFTFGDGAKPTSREAAEIMAVNPDHTLNYVGFIGMIAYGSGTNKLNGKPLTRIRFI